ncbi:MAG: PQQ-dependent sugar dehydrogenase [Myxococcales bacterium]|jgi:uncharacterized repeat protein (TIGR03806 family)
MVRVFPCLLGAGLALGWLAACGDGVQRVPAHDFPFPAQVRLSDSALRLVEPFPELTFHDPVSMVEGGGRFFVAEQGGRVLSFDPKAREPEATVVLDLLEHTQGGDDNGLLAIALHPDFGRDGAAARGDFFVYYTHHDRPVAADDAPLDRVTRARLTRFSIPDGELAADPGSETVLIDQRDRHLWHQGSGMFFHPRDGFLYLAIGDEGSTGCGFDTCQRIDDGLFGGVLRIDVDERGGDVSHPIRRMPRDGVTDHYFIPDDNPFVDDPDVLEEFYAVGLRNPHRMTHDPIDGVTFIGDVGHQQEEEVDVLSPGANYQWDVMEGHSLADHNPDPSRIRPGVWTDPLLSYRREELRVLIGGHVYRGDAIPALYGRYVHADYYAGTLWAADYELRSGEVIAAGSEPILETTLARRSDGITSFATDAAGRLYVLHLGEAATIRELVADDGAGAPVPERLSETGLFSDLQTLTPAAPLVEYRVNVPLWSDGAVKRRFVARPDDSPLPVDADGSIGFPPGTLFVKHFEIALDPRKPSERRRLETRVLVLTEGGVYGVTYRWNDAGDDAVLLTGHEEEELPTLDAEGGPAPQTYVYPSPGECLQCHDPQGRRSLGFEVAQLDRQVDGEDQLRQLARRGVIRLPAGQPPGDWPRLRALDDEAAPLEARARSYLHANCSHCHGPQKLGDARWDARIETPLDEAGIIDAPAVARGAPSGARILAPGEPERSELLRRVRSENPAVRMPPLASLRAHDDFVDVLKRYVESLR